jgi:hypothetical protein
MLWAVSLSHTMIFSNSSPGGSFISIEKSWKQQGWYVEH